MSLCWFCRAPAQDALQQQQQLLLIIIIILPLLILLQSNASIIAISTVKLANSQLAVYLLPIITMVISIEEETVIMHCCYCTCDIVNAHDSNGIFGHRYCEDKSTEHTKH